MKFWWPKDSWVQNQKCCTKKYSTEAKIFWDLANAFPTPISWGGESLSHHWNDGGVRGGGRSPLVGRRTLQNPNLQKIGNFNFFAAPLVRHIFRYLLLVMAFITLLVTSFTTDENLCVNTSGGNPYAEICSFFRSI